MNLETIAAKRGLTVRELSPGHFRIEGGERVVDYWPDSKRRTAFVVGTQDSTPRCTPDMAVAMAGEPTPKETVAEAPRKRTVREWIALLPHMRFAFTKKQREAL